MSGSFPTSFPLNSQLPNSPSLLPAIGFGTFQPDPHTPPGTVKASVLTAIRLGYRHIDTAYAYDTGKVEKEVGEAIKECGVPRKELFIVTKLHNTFHAPEDVEVGMNWSLRNLGVDYVDLYLMHFPHAYKYVGTYDTVRDKNGKPIINYDLSRRYSDTWKAMEELVRNNKTRFIGLSNFSVLKTKKILEVASIHPAVNQVEMHPYLPQRKLLEFCKQNDIHVTAHSPLGGAPVAVVASGKPGPLDDPKIKSLAASLSLPPSQILLSWALMRGTSVIPKSNNLARIRSNVELQQLPDEAFKIVDSIRQGEEMEPGDRRNNPIKHIGFDIYDENIDEPVEARG